MNHIFINSITAFPTIANPILENHRPGRREGSQIRHELTIGVGIHGWIGDGCESTRIQTLFKLFHGEAKGSCNTPIDSESLSQWAFSGPSQTLPFESGEEGVTDRPENQPENPPECHADEQTAPEPRYLFVSEVPCHS